MNKYTVRIILEELEICAESEERANEIAQDIMESDAYTRLHHGLTVVDYATELEEENVDEEELKYIRMLHKTNV